ncbi:ubiquinone/menaquinone biosynthesis C-methylase UbiE [Sedimentibacter acidaminivorans]|uniref:Ubiquinone/menaquinone biosynthesis C-methylase UbiE n=1 Tax=Sedimentibacter acidaminivorans TaxID=913099 RepID=A0ABS4GDU8_9FIRM|nr:class I SAM-dependent methyltransferase [Sedimentibacter acidaminivorans]MBP1925873.1 ubiquinone/menaquinone biosynthesis C-methylase UbiE [Sedimentibacter acidaminivorans]
MKGLNEKLCNMKFGSILDIATRDGAFIKRLVNNLSGYDEITGIDISNEGFEKAEAEFAGNNKIRFQVMDGCHTNFPNKYFDLVCISNSLHHVNDIPALLKEILRIKKDDGIILISEMPADGQSGSSLTHALIHNLDCLIDTYSGVYHHQTYSHKEILEFISDAGMRVEDDFDDLEVNLLKNESIAKRVDKALIKVNKWKDSENYEELHKVAMKIKENYNNYGASPAIQYIIFAK